MRQGDVEDWVIENRSTELHAFHIHQVHFPAARVVRASRWTSPSCARHRQRAFYDGGKSGSFPSVRVRMDFRDPDAVGTFLYHCHLLEHEDGGMMGTIRVEPANALPRARLAP